MTNNLEMSSVELKNLEDSSQSNMWSHQSEPQSLIDICLTRCPWPDECHQFSQKCPRLQAEKSGKYDHLRRKFYPGPSKEAIGKEWLTMREAKKLLNRGDSYIRRRLADGRIEGKMEYGIWLIKAEGLVGK